MKLHRALVVLIIVGLLQAGGLEGTRIKKQVHHTGGLVEDSYVLAAAPVEASQPYASPVEPPAIQIPHPSGERTYSTFVPTIHVNYPFTLASQEPVFPVLGVETHANFGLSKLPEFPGSWVRRNAVLWSEIEPEPGERRWEIMREIEGELVYAAEHGSQAILIVRSTPTWAQKVPGSFCGPIEAEDFPAFARFMADLVTRYSQPPYSVKYWEIWNEPDVTDTAKTPDWQFGCWGDDDDPYYGGGYYAEMLKAIYPAIKAADPEAQVLVGGLMLDCDPLRPGICEGKPARFLEGILRNDGGYYFDGIGFHAYEYYNYDLGSYVNKGWGTFKAVPTIKAKAQFIRTLLDQYGKSDKYLINTETAIVVYSDTCNEECELTKAYYMPQLFSTAMALGLRGSLWYSVKSGWQHNDLFSLQNEPLPAYQAYLVAWERMGQATFRQEVALSPEVQIYEFDSRGRKLWVLWSLDGKEHRIDLPGMVLSAVDALGQEITGLDGTLLVGVNPVYLEWTK